MLQGSPSAERVGDYGHRGLFAVVAMEIQYDEFEVVIKGRQKIGGAFAFGGGGGLIFTVGTGTGPTISDILSIWLSFVP